MRSLVSDPTLVLCALILSGGILQDLYFRKVKNSYTVFCLLVAVIYLLLSPFFADNNLRSISSDTSVFETLQSSGFFLIYKNLLLSLFLTFVLYLFKVFGAGDAKIFIVASLLIPFTSIAPSLFYALIWGALLGIFKSLLSGQLGLLLKRVFHSIFQFGNSIAIKNYSFSTLKSSTAIPFTIPLLLGILTQANLVTVGLRFL